MPKLSTQLNKKLKIENYLYKLINFRVVKKILKKRELLFLVTLLMASNLFSQSNSTNSCQTPDYKKLYDIIHTESINSIVSYFEALNGQLTRDTVVQLSCSLPSCTKSYKDFIFCENELFEWKVLIIATPSFSVDIKILTNNFDLYSKMFNSITKYNSIESSSACKRIYITKKNFEGPGMHEASGLEANFCTDGVFGYQYEMEFYYLGK